MADLKILLFMIIKLQILGKEWREELSPNRMDTAEPDLERPLPGPLYSTPGVLQALHDDEEAGVDVQHHCNLDLFSLLSWNKF